MQLEQIPCPRCGRDFPKKRKELGFHVCTLCSTVKPVVGITTVEGEGDHTYNDLIIMDQDKAMAIARAAAEIVGRKSHMEFLDLDDDEDDIKYKVIQERASNIMNDSSDDDYEEPVQEEEEEEIDF